MRPMTIASSQDVSYSDSSWKSILECAALEVFEMMAGVRVELFSPSADEPSGEQTAMVGLGGALCGMLAVRCSKGTSAKLAALMLGGMRHRIRLPPAMPSANCAIW